MVQIIWWTESNLLWLNLDSVELSLLLSIENIIIFKPRILIT